MTLKVSKFAAFLCLTGSLTLSLVSCKKGDPGPAGATGARIIITRFTNDNSASIGLSTILQYRYVIIPGGKVSTAYAEATHQGQGTKFNNGGAVEYDRMTYQQICGRFSIPQ